MLDKKIIKNNFKKSILTYDKNAFVQKKMAQKLIHMLPERKFASILEIGSYTGILTKEIKQKIEYREYFALDIIENSKEFVKKIDENIVFINEDIENFKTNKKFDLIIANASLQWCRDFSSVILNLKSHLAQGGILAIAIFSKDNLFEIKEAFGVALNYISSFEVKEIFSKKANFEEEKILLKFENSLDILRHLKATGVNSLKSDVLNYSQIKKGLKILEEKFENKLTYTPVYIID